tara:strand:- start:2 stop:517 length:516 start_codon:yes stop_codon:yes gene_type:complete
MEQIAKRCPTCHRKYSYEKPTTADILALFEKKVDKDTASGCHLWTANKNSLGYGMFSGGSRTAKGAHRFAYKTYIGEIPPGMLVLHTCNVRNCVNPDHLKLGTHKENMEHMVKSGNSGKGKAYNTLTERQVRDIRKAIANDETVVGLAKKYSVCSTTISRIKNNRTWTHIK